MQIFRWEDKWNYTFPQFAIDLSGFPGMMWYITLCLINITMENHHF